MTTMTLLLLVLMKDSQAAHPHFILRFTLRETRAAAAPSANHVTQAELILRKLKVNPRSHFY